MHLVRGRADTPSADRAATAAMLDQTAESGEPAFRVWTPHRQVTFGRRDAAEEGYDAARKAARERGFTPTERSVGGRAVAYTGTTLTFAHARPIDDPRRGLGDRYDAAMTSVRRALAELGVDATEGEPPDAFCPGSHSLQSDGKIVGIAQRVRSGAALVSGIVIVDDPAAIGDVLNPVYDALGVPFDPASVGSIAGAGGPAEPGPIARALEAAFVGEETRTVLSVGEFVEE